MSFWASGGKNSDLAVYAMYKKGDSKMLFLIREILQVFLSWPGVAAQEKKGGVESKGKTIFLGSS